MSNCLSTRADYWPNKVEVQWGNNLHANHSSSATSRSSSVPTLSIEANFGLELADTFRRNLHPDVWARRN